MKILSIQTSNFRLHADSSFGFPGEGVVGIIGSNESGKSTVLEALLWALFGTAATRGTKGSLRWNRAPARHTASVTLRFMIGGKTYTLERGENTARLLDEASGECVAESTSGVDSFVPGLIGMTHDEFRASFLCSQRDLNRMASMGPTERQAFIRSVLGVGKIDEALKTCRKRKNELAAERQGIEAGLGEREPLAKAVSDADAELLAADQYTKDMKADVQTQAKVLEEETAALARWDEKKERHDGLSAVLREADARKSAHEREEKRIVSDLAQARGAAKDVEAAQGELAKLPGLRDERDALRDARVRKDERDDLLDRQEDLQGEVAQLDVDMNVAEKEASRLEAVESARAAADERVSTLRATLGNMRSARLEKKAQKEAGARQAQKEAASLEEKAKDLLDLGADSPCPTCTRALGDALDAVVRTLTEQAVRQRRMEDDASIDAEELSHATDDEIETEIALEAAMEDAVVGAEQVRHAMEAQATGRRLEAERTKAYERLQAVEARLKDFPTVEFDADRLSVVEAEVRRLEVLDGSLIEKRGLASRIPALEADLEAVALRIETAVNDADEAREGLDELAFDQDGYTKAKTTHWQAQKDAEASRVALARAEAALEAAEKACRTAYAALEEWDVRSGTLKSIAQQHSLHEKVDARLSDFRVAVAGTIRPELEELVSGFVHLLTDGRHEAVTLTEDFTPILHESGVPTEVVSGGTEDITALAMRLAISQMIAERAGHPLSLLILDEPFGSLDETRRGNVLGLIRRLRGVFDQVVVISHVAETRDAVDHVIELEYDEAMGKTLIRDTAPAIAAA